MVANMTEIAADADPPAYTVPMSLSPSRVGSFTSCPMQFRFSSIQKLPEPPGIATTKGTIVHRALELLFDRPLLNQRLVMRPMTPFQIGFCRTL